ncbi:semaphorin-4E-like [Xyrauchen texanus]|uniref:semaphorin-4E-like n=1 Tax=Xyrauchen texanus TaxID=154827 RepID=UPI00224237C6|nr:semaphorin-4E-like [Xyrauchen texanus]XP_051978366.1 semaphorin-4E-like [Xyrauchen texanus]XP_051978367.1 semaphorin-4E-like [Xyrauchen texanus]
MYSLLLFLTVLHGILLACAYTLCSNLNCIARKTITYEDNHVIMFKEEGIWNYSTMLIREDLGLLILGAREAVYALDINDISVANSKVLWKVTEEKQNECSSKGKHPDIDCHNYVRMLHQVNDSVMYVCGTNAFSPTCDYLTYSDGQLKLDGKQEEGRGKCPFDPFQRYSSVMADQDLYSATSFNFLGSEPVILRTSPITLRTVFKSSWLNEPNFIYMDMVPESEDSPEGDDDKIYMFFSENAVEYDFYNKLVVSRVARVCKGDMGGQRTLQRKWTSFLKARLDCSALEPSLPYIIQDVFYIRHKKWRKSVFYAVFTSQSSSTDQSSTVCAYNVTDISEVFSRGKFKTAVTVETSDVKWVMYNGELPVPRPGACINNAARSLGIERSLDLPDKTLQFIRDRPLMDDAVRPITGKPLLVKRGPLLTRLVVDHVTALDGQLYPVMFVGTENGYVQKGVNYDGEMHIIEEVKLFENAEAIDVLRLYQSQVFAGSASGVIQMYVSNCSRYFSCLDCVLARDPYCAWDLTAQQCSRLPREPKDAKVNFIQSLKDGDATWCPITAAVEPKIRTLVLGNNIRLLCQPDSNLARVRWNFAGKLLPSSNKKYTIYSDGILIYNASVTDTGHYTCMSVEWVKGRQYTQTLAIYDLQQQLVVDVTDKIKTTVGINPTSSGFHKLEEPPSLPQSQTIESKWIVMQVALAVLSVMMACLLIWNLYMGHISPFMCCVRQAIKSPRNLCEREYQHTTCTDTLDSKQQMVRLCPTSNSDQEAASFRRNTANGVMQNDMPICKYITDESEI